MKDIQYSNGEIVTTKREIERNPSSFAKYKFIGLDCHKPNKCFIETDGNVKDEYIANILKVTDELFELVGKTKWDVQGVNMDNGYFGSYSHICVNGKEVIVFVDDRDAKINVVTGFHTKIFYGKGLGHWDGDSRWNSDKPLVVFDEGKGYNLVQAHTPRLICQEYLKELSPKFYWNGNTYVAEGTDHNGRKVLVTDKGTIIPTDDALNAERDLEYAKSLAIGEIQTEWIGKGKPCYHIHGLEYKGARVCKIDNGKAAEMFKTHKSFNTMFASAEWRIIDGRAALLLRDYANSDYD